MSTQYYYLVSQLPDISAVTEKSNLPITEAYYRDLCSRFLTEHQLEILNNLSLVPPKDVGSTGSAFLDKWYENERGLRYALAQIRAQKMKKNFDMSSFTPQGDVVQAARTAIGMDSPLSAEQFLHEYRMGVLNNLHSLDYFSVDAIYEYGIRLLLVQRMKKFNKETGVVSYRKIYDSILEKEHD